jgi:hypothetical protein
LVKRQLLHIDDSVKPILWGLKEVQQLENLGVTDVPRMVPELIKTGTTDVRKRFDCKDNDSHHSLPIINFVENLWT